jgi:cobalt-zinc-cadmium efflux system protein
MVAEVVASFITGSLALLSDAAHMFTDAAALAISLIALRIAQRAADQKRTFGYYRFEILAAALNAVLLLIVAAYILFEAYRRLRAPEAIQSTWMLVVAVIGLVINLISMRLLRAGSETSLNVKGAYLEVWSDMLGSIGVILGAVLIRFTGALWLDPLIACLIGLWVVPRSWVLLKEALNILLQGAPKGMNLQEIESAMRAVPGVVEIHDLHVWSLTSGKHVLSAHVVADLSRCTEQEVLAQINAGVARFDIHHSTTQIEAQGFPCGAEEERDAASHSH